MVAFAGSGGRQAPRDLKQALDVASVYVSHIAKPLSGHLASLRAAKLVTSERRGTTILYALNMAALESVIAALTDIANAKRSKMA